MGKPLPWPVVFVYVPGIQNLHGLAQIVHDDDGVVEEIPAQNAVSPVLPGGFREILCAIDDQNGAM